MNEMHEFIFSPTLTEENVEANAITPTVSTTDKVSDSSNETSSKQFNPYAPPLPKPIISDFLNDPINVSINTINRMGNLVRMPTIHLYHHGYNILNNLTNPINVQSGSNPATPGTAERIIIKANESIKNKENNQSIPFPPPVLPLIQCTHKQTRLEPLSSEEFKQKTWNMNTLRQRVFAGGISDELRLRLWPLILGLVDVTSVKNLNINEIEIDWPMKNKLYQHYRSQWEAILPEQEKRFMLFRERKSLIERDVIRCDRTHPFYNKDNNENLEKLKEILLTYMMYDFDTGYVQGMSDLASPLLYVSEGDTCKAFWFFVKFMEFTNNNFEVSQLTIKYQLEMLWRLIELTDPIFANYLVNNDSVNCYFAFRWIVCNFKREFMKSNTDDYQDVLLLWESIWTCSSVKKSIRLPKQSIDQNLLNNEIKKTIDGKNEKNSAKNTDDLKKIQIHSNVPETSESNLVEKLNIECKIDDSENSASLNNSSSKNNDIQPIPIKRLCSRTLSDTELYILCICLAIIRRERDLIMMNRLDAPGILKHFNTLMLTSNLKDVLIHAANIWSWLIIDGNDKLLYENFGKNCADNGCSFTVEGRNIFTNKINNQSIDAEDFDLLPDLMIERPSSFEDALFNST